MKVYQIISERKQLNEFVPVILGGMGFAGAMAVIGAFLTGLSIYELTKMLSKYNNDPESLTDDDWDNILIDLSLLALPGAARLGRAALVKVLPRSMVRKGSAMIKKKALDRMKKERATATQKYGSAAQAGKTPQQAAKMQQKLIKASAASRKKAQAKIKSFPPKLYSAISLGIGTKYALDYWEKIIELEDQYAKWQAGDRATEIFGAEESKEEVDRIAYDVRTRLIGQLTTGVLAAVASGPLAKVTDVGGKVLGSMLGFISGGMLKGGLISVPATIAAKLIKFAGPGLTLFLTTETGQKFLGFAFVDMIMQGIGKVTEKTLNSIYDVVDELAKKAGIDGATDALRSPIKDPKPSTVTNPDGSVVPRLLDKTPSSLKVGTDPNNPKIKFVGGVQITDAQGFQAVGDNYLNDIKNNSRVAKMPDPTAGIPKKPGVNYNY
jgi:hypothetical protein